ncbi:MAG: heme exporter protein CcmB [Pseudomonadota bacterium]
MSAAPLWQAFRSAAAEAWAGGAGALLPLGFFAGTCLLVPFSVGSKAATLSAIGPGILWLALALASLVTLERVFQADVQDGALDLWVQLDQSLSVIAAIKTLAHWCVSGLPLVLLTPIFAIMLQVPADDLVPAMLAYALGGVSFFMWGGVAAALAASVARGGLLIALLALPFYLPAIIFGALALNEGLGGTAILFLAASTLFSLGVAPAAMGAALRLAAD